MKRRVKRKGARWWWVEEDEEGEREVCILKQMHEVFIDEESKKCCIFKP